MNKKLTLGSLFDGSGGFPLGAVLNGIAPVWASEIEPFPIRVTTKRLPFMKHYGDISKIDGSKIEPVDIITFGSPCTDMSIAGKRAGLDGKQSVLFYEAIRIIKEMRKATDGRYPRFILWENVPGAFSSNKGADFKAVLEAVAGIVCPEAEVPAPDKGGWPYADILVGDGWSVAYRTVDAQYFGVAQRRRRIYLVADFAGECACDVLFEREGVSRDFAQRFRKGQGSAGGIEVRAGTAVAFEPGVASRLGGHVWENLAGTLRADAGDNQTAVAIQCYPQDGRAKLDDTGKVQTLTSRMGTGGNNVPLTLKIRSGCEGGGKGALVQDDMSATLSCNTDQTVFIPKPMSIAGNVIDRSVKSGGDGLGVNDDVSFTLNTADRHAVAYAMTTGEFTEVHEEKAATLMARDYKDMQIVNQARYIVRRLTPTECARLQGFPDWWCDGLETPEPMEEEIAWWAEVFETHRRICGTSSKPKSRNQIVKWLGNPLSDSAEYKMWGNGVALPCVCFALRGIVDLIQNGAE